MTFVAFTLLFSSCKTSNEPAVTLSVNPDRASSKERFEDNTTNVSYLKLESSLDYIVSQVSKLYVADSLIFIFDRKQAHVFSFTMNGDFRFVVKEPDSEVGKKFEYIRDIHYDQYTGHLFIVDGNANLIYEFDDQGNYVQEMVPIVRPSAIFKLDEDTWIANNAWVGKGQYPDKIYLLNNGFNMVIDSGIEGSFGNISLPNPIVKMGDRILFKHGFDANVYDLTEGRFEAIKKVDFGKYNVTQKLLSQPNGQVMRNFLSGDFAGATSNYMESQENIVFTYTRGSKTRGQKRSRLMIMDSETLEPILHTTELVFGENQLPISKPSFQYEGYFISTIDFYEINLFNEEAVGSKEKQGASDSKGWLKSFDEVQKLTKEYDSPVLMFYQFK